ncbi:MAG: efflux RND transporter periplasmic adaptor subunit [Xanthomonadales bacterium]|jgi:RND family efflux transporter MFP subunit|nr:efflux RND transporter periplasmic adaptor subunit [Xanthomonadales bacterium]
MADTELLKQLKIDRGARAPAPGRGPWPWIAGLAVLGMLVLGGLWLGGDRDAPVQVRTAIVQSAAAAAGPSAVLEATGYVTARRVATVSAKVTGKVAEVRIEEGQLIRAGEIMATLEAVDVERAVALSEAQSGQSRAQLAETRVALANAEREWNRQRELVARKLTSQQAADAAEVQVQSLKARLAAQQAAVTVSEQALAQRRQDLDNLVIRAPFDGVVIAKAAQPGEMISPLSAGGGFTRTGVGTLVDMDSLEIEVDVSESYIQRVAAGQPVEAVLNAYPDWKIPASVIAIIPTADRTKATVKVRIGFGERDTRIVPDMGVRVAFLSADPSREPAAAPAGVLVPPNALRRDPDEVVAFVVVDGRLQRRPLQLGERIGGQQQVLQGLSTGERVVLDPAASLREGQSSSN